MPAHSPVRPNIRGQGILQGGKPHTAAYDIAIAACGYERRARTVGELLDPAPKRRIAFAFRTSRGLSFLENESWFKEHSWEVVDIEDSELSSYTETVLRAAGKSSTPLRVAIDVSSQSRSRLASIVAALGTVSQENQLLVDFYYSLASYSQRENISLPNVEVGPVSPAFAGWYAEPDLPSALVIGLGYEQDRALGAVEFLEPAELRLLIPNSPMQEYRDAVMAANVELLRTVRSEKKVEYDVQDPRTTFSKLASLVSHLKIQHNVVLIPSGPKLFALLCLLLAQCDQTLTVWRVSAGTREPMVERTPSGTTLWLSVEYTERGRRDDQPSLA